MKNLAIIFGLRKIKSKLEDKKQLIILTHSFTCPSCKTPHINFVDYHVKSLNRHQMDIFRSPECLLEKCKKCGLDIGVLYVYPMRTADFDTIYI